MATMREIVLKTVKGEDGMVSYQELLSSILKMPGGHGVDYSELELVLPIRRAIRLAKAPEGETPKALVSEDEFKKLVNILTASFKGFVVVEENLQFVRDIKESKSVEVAPVQSA